ncbi:prepilin peptidase [Streptomyces sp. MUM 136J]|uniref:prepilin peptidase n=1 Tax=Streptomyces sp. MUM 136J TaxID=2791992 RepID=UPI001F03591A|nr:A24 family peptidase [Streptomyces sp. MUM 136J]MCH0568612.1 prepilin peptidase [Streptomyces sp. MUM 136J]
MHDPDVIAVAVAAVWGAVAGALLPRAVYRFSVPAGEDWRAACPSGHPLPGWAGRARCALCPPADARYGTGTAALPPVAALVCAALAGATGTRPELAAWLLLAPAGVLLTAVDMRVRRLPDALTLPLAAAALGLLGLAALLPEHAGSWPTAFCGALALGAGYYLLFRINPGGMGFGDVKLALGVGAVLGWYGWGTVLLGTFAAFLLGALFGGALVLAGRAGRRTAIPFGPFMAAGAFVGVLVGAYSV